MLRRNELSTTATHGRVHRSSTRWAFSTRVVRHLRAFGVGSLLKYGILRLRTLLWFQIQTLTLRPLSRSQNFLADDSSDIIVTLTTFPERITTVWATLQSILRQTVPVKAVVLVLAEDEFPRRHVPRTIRRLARDRIRILWIEKSMRSFGKLLPAKAAFPSATLVTVDDDVIYSRDMIERLVRASRARPHHIIGHRGWDPLLAADGPLTYGAWMTNGGAGPDSDPGLVFLTGVGGVLYPPGRQLDAVLLDFDTANRTAPTADDVWFWAAALAAEVPRYCTGEEYGSPNGLEGLSRNLYSTNQHRNDEQIAAVIDALDLRRRLVGKQ